MKTHTTHIIDKNNLIAFILLVSLFFCWGLAGNMTDTLLAAFKKIMSMTDFQTSWIQLAYYGAYFCLALPAAMFIKRFSYKSGIILGLVCYITGSFLFYPASLTLEYNFFLVALFILAGGCSIIETSTNPYVYSLGDPETGTQRLNLAQAFNPVGSITGVVLSQLFILSELDNASASERSRMTDEMLERVQSIELSHITMTYIGVALILLVIMLAIAAKKMPEIKDVSKSDSLGVIFKRLIHKPHYVLGVLAQFFYIGAQIGVWSYTIRYVMSELSVNEVVAANYYTVSLILFSSFRFVFTFLMKFISPLILLMFAAIMGAFCALMVVILHGEIACVFLVAISAFMSLMFPTIYGLAAKGLGDDTKVGGSGLIMAILGGAVFTAIQGQVSDKFHSMHISFVVPILCFVVVCIYCVVYRVKKWDKI